MVLDGSLCRASRRSHALGITSHIYGISILGLRSRTGGRWHRFRSSIIERFGCDPGRLCSRESEWISLAPAWGGYRHDHCRRSAGYPSDRIRASVDSGLAARVYDCDESLIVLLGGISYVFNSSHAFGFGSGALERIVQYPQSLWLILFGFYISREHWRSGVTGPSFKFTGEGSPDKGALRWALRLPRLVNRPLSGHASDLSAQSTSALDEPRTWLSRAAVAISERLGAPQTYSLERWHGHSHDVGMGSIAEIRVLLCSTDERTRALAVRSICPCHGSFEPLRELNTEIRHLAFGDPSARVRGEAKHVLGDALVLNVHDEEKLMRDERWTAINERAARRRAAADSRQFRRGRSRRSL